MPQNNIMIREKQIKIFTFGKFNIKQGDLIISEDSTRSKKVWEIFKFLLSNREKVYKPEIILEKIWPDDNYIDPNTAMRALIFRLRNVLRPDPAKPSLADNITFSHGCYVWEDKIPYWLDADEFKSSASKAASLISENPEEAITSYHKAIALYCGEYLPESIYSEWVSPNRTYYHEIYLDCIFGLSDLLMEKRVYAEVVKLCEKAAKSDYFEEKIHIKLIEALIAEGQASLARAHYNEVTSAFYREMGIKPSAKMKNLYRLAGTEPGSFELDLDIIQEGLKGKESVKGAFYCDADLFCYFYRLDRLRVERNGQSVLLGLITLTKPDYSKPDYKILQSVMTNLQTVIIGSLRKGDLVTRWSDAQFLLLLPGLNREQADMVMNRIEKFYHKDYSLQGLILHIKVGSLLPLEDDSHFS